MSVELILLTYLCYRNSVKARLKGKNPVAWVIFTIIAYFVAMMIGMMFVIFNFCRDAVDMNQLSSPDKGTREAASQRIVQAVSGNTLHYITVELIALGGYLFVRYLLDRIPDKKEPEIHWMDRLGGD